MFRVHRIDSLDLPALAPYRTMKRQVDHQSENLFVAEGEKVVRRLLESHLVIISVVLPEKWLQNYTALLAARMEELQVYVAEKKVLEQLTGYSMYQGVLALAQIPAPASLPALLESSPRPYLFAAVDGLSSAENLGVLVRNCGAFGVQGLLVGETSGSPYLRRAVRASMGVVFQLPVVPVRPLAEAVRQLRRHHLRCIAAHPHEVRITLAQANLTGDCCLVFGSEGYGISAEVRAACDEAVAIPMRSGVDSLNVGSASAVFLYEASRQRDKR